MRVSLNLIKKYVDIPKSISNSQIAYDLTIRTVEVENVIDLGKRYENIVVGRILKVKAHPNADRLKICLTDIGEEKPVQIVCGGSNLYEGEYVVVSKPGSYVVWHGEGDAVLIKETSMRGEVSYGMICAAREVFLSDIFPSSDEAEIVDLKDIPCKPGDNIADVLFMRDVILEIDNKSLSNRPDLWGHLGIAREICAIYDLKLKELPVYKFAKELPKYQVEIKDSTKCNRYIAVEIDNIKQKSSPLWMQAMLSNLGQRPINAIVDITNYVMLAVGQPLHAFDKKHVHGEKIVIRNAYEGEELLLIGDNSVKLTTDDLVISDDTTPLALAGIRGGKKDSILKTTTGIVLEVANFDAKTIRKTDKRFLEKTDASIRYEKGLDTQTVDLGLNLAMELITEIFEDSKVIKYNDVYPNKTLNKEIIVPEEFLDTRLGKKIDNKTIIRILISLGYTVDYQNGIYKCIVPTNRSTGDVSMKDDVMGDIARILSFNSFEPKPITMSFDKPVIQNDYLLERRIREYLSTRCGFYEIYTYPWIDEKYINALKLDLSKSLRLATPPSPTQAYLRSSLLPGLVEATQKNLRYFEEFSLYEIGEVYEVGSYSPSCKEEVLPVQTKYLSGAIVGRDAKEILFTAKGVIEQMARYTHMEKLRLLPQKKPSWADAFAYMDILLGNEIIGKLGLLSVGALNASKIKRTNIALFEMNMDKLIPLKSRTNKFVHLPELPLVEKDLSIIVSEDVTWKVIESSIKNLVHELDFVDEYRGSSIPSGKKSITFKFKILNVDKTMTMEEINEVITKILEVLAKKCNAKLRSE